MGLDTLLSACICASLVALHAHKTPTTRATFAAPRATLRREQNARPRAGGFTRNCRTASRCTITTPHAKDRPAPIMLTWGPGMRLHVLAQRWHSATKAITNMYSGPHLRIPRTDLVPSHAGPPVPAAAGRAMNVVLRRWTRSAATIVREWPWAPRRALAHDEPALSTLTSCFPGPRSHWRTCPCILAAQLPRTLQARAEMKRGDDQVEHLLSLFKPAACD